MNMELLVAKLIELRKDTDVDSYILFREMGGGFESEKTKEYDSVEHSLEDAFKKEIEERMAGFFSNINLRSFDFKQIDGQINDVRHNHWNSRSQVEINRDNLLNWQYHYYDYKYKISEKYKQFLAAQNRRISAKEEIEQEVNGDFKNQFVQELLDNKIQSILRRKNHFERNLYLKTKSEEVFRNRNLLVAERDIYGYIDVETYEKCAAIGIGLAIAFLQKESKEEIIGGFLISMRDKLKKEGDMYSGNLADEFYDLLENYLKNRPPGYYGQSLPAFQRKVYHLQRS